MYSNKNSESSPLNYTISSPEISNLFQKNIRKTEDERLMIADYILV